MVCCLVAIDNYFGGVVFGGACGFVIVICVWLSGCVGVYFWFEFALDSFICAWLTCGLIAA